MQEVTKIRESNFELCRLFAIFSVLMYHGISFYIMKYNPDNMYGHALWLPFRTAVSLFVLISGYFGIKATIMGGAKLVLKTLIYFVPIQVIFLLYSYVKVHDLIMACLPISNGPYWFITTYLCLFMLSPFLNEYLLIVDVKKRVTLIMVFSFLSLYLGFVGPVDGPLALGKNVIHFILLYVVGNSIRNNRYLFDRFSTRQLIIIYLIIGILPVFFFCMVANTKITYLMCMFDRDNGIFLFMSAVVLFLLFSRIHLKSKTINYLATSVFAIYLLQQQPVISSSLGDFFYKVWPHEILPIDNSFTGTLPLFFFIFIRSICYMVIFIIIDKLLAPIWRLISNVSSFLEKTIKANFNQVFFHGQ